MQSFSVRHCLSNGNSVYERTDVGGVMFGFGMTVGRFDAAVVIRSVGEPLSFPGAHFRAH